jgi:hypothetical protein
MAPALDKIRNFEGRQSTYRNSPVDDLLHRHRDVLYHNPVHRVRHRDFASHHPLHINWDMALDHLLNWHLRMAKVIAHAHEQGAYPDTFLHRVRYLNHL